MVFISHYTICLWGQKINYLILRPKIYIIWQAGILFLLHDLQRVLTLFSYSNLRYSPFSYGNKINQSMRQHLNILWQRTNTRFFFWGGGLSLQHNASIRMYRTNAITVRLTTWSDRALFSSSNASTRSCISSSSAFNCDTWSWDSSSTESFTLFVCGFSSS